MKVLVTGGAGFIGSALVRYLIGETEYEVVNLDALTYAGNLESLGMARESPRYAFEHADVCDGPAVASILGAHQPDAIIHLAAESHVDRSIDSPGQFVKTNVVGTSELLSAATAYWERLPRARADRFRMLHVSTDEVFGSLDGDGGYFTEETPYRPSSPYSASKAGADHLVRAWVRTYGFPALITNCSNNYGPCQFPEKLIPLMILNGLERKPLPVYGRGENVRDWLYVDDHVRALVLVLERGRLGECYAIGGGAERRNIDVVHTVARLLDELAPDPDLDSHQSLIRFVEDRPGHDLRYAIDASKIRGELGWRPRESFETGLAKTVAWYIDNREWWERVRSGEYRGERLGLGSRV